MKSFTRFLRCTLALTCLCTSFDGQSQTSSAGFQKHYEKNKAAQLLNSQSLAKIQPKAADIAFALRYNASKPKNVFEKEMNQTIRGFLQKAYPNMFYSESFIYEDPTKNPGWFTGEDSLQKCVMGRYKYTYQSLTEKGTKVFCPRLLPADSFDVKVLITPYSNPQQNATGFDLGDYRFLYAAGKGISVTASGDDLQKPVEWLPIKTRLPFEVSMIVRYVGNKITFVLGKDAGSGEYEGDVIWTGTRSTLTPPSQFALVAQGKQTVEVRNIDVRSLYVYKP